MNREARIELAFLERVRARCPGWFPVLDALGSLYTRHGRVEEGLAIDRALVAMRPADATVRYNLACSLALSADPDGALAALEEAVRLGYRDFEWMARDGDLRSLHGDPRFRRLLDSAGLLSA
jgi:predicted Zn-dependent protease